MKPGPWWRWLLASVAILTAAGQELGLSFSANPAPAKVAQQAVYTLTVTNLSGQVLSNLVVQVALSGDVVLIGATNSLGTATNVASLASFSFSSFTNATLATLTYGGVPTTYGIVTHTVVASIGGISTEIGAFLSTNIAGNAALGIAFGALPGGNVVNDLVGYTLTVTNRGPDDAVGAEIFHSLPGGLQFVAVAPSSVPATVSGDQLRLRLGTLASAAGRLLELSVRPTQTGTQTLTAHVEAPGYVNPNPQGATGQTSLAATNAFLAGLQATNVSPQVFNPQTGLMEQRIRLTHQGSNGISAARVLLSGLRDWLYNASGTNGTTPFVTYPAALNPGQSVDFLVTYFSETREPGPDPALSALSVPVPVVPAPVGTNIGGVRVRAWTHGASLVEFPAVEGRRYAIRYASTPAFTNAWTVQPLVTAPGSWVQWLDQGPPATLSLPTNAPARFYRIIGVPTP